MFAYVAGESIDAADRKARLRAEAMKKWPFLTALDLTMTRSESRLSALISERSGRPLSETAPLVHMWLRDDAFGSANGSLDLNSREDEWENEGGSKVLAPATPI